MCLGTKSHIDSIVMSIKWLFIEHIPQAKYIVINCQGKVQGFPFFKPTPSASGSGEWGIRNTNKFTKVVSIGQWVPKENCPNLCISWHLSSLWSLHSNLWEQGHMLINHPGWHLTWKPVLCIMPWIPFKFSPFFMPQNVFILPSFLANYFTRYTSLNY